MFVSPLVFLCVLLGVLITLVIVDRVVVLVHRAKLCALAGRLEMHFAAGDRFRLAAKIASHLPAPGAAEVAVRDLLYCKRSECHHYIFLAEYTIGATRAKRRRKVLASWSEDGKGNSPGRLTVAGDDRSIAAYQAIASSLMPGRDGEAAEPAEF